MKPPPGVRIRPATRADAGSVSEVLLGAAKWLEDRGTPMWKGDELQPENTRTDIEDGLFFVAELDGAVLGVIKFQLEDQLFWPDLPAAEAAFVHRLAVRRDFAGKGVSTALLAWAEARARSIGRGFLRLDCEAGRPRLRAFYERFGFRHHSDRQVGPYFVSRYELPLTDAARPPDH
ncbi:MAG: GNAT family N-acetyltransferase [Verrucomicrobiales bacterium]